MTLSEAPKRRTFNINGTGDMPSGVLKIIPGEWLNHFLFMAYDHRPLPELVARQLQEATGYPVDKHDFRQFGIDGEEPTWFRWNCWVDEVKEGELIDGNMDAKS